MRIEETRFFHPGNVYARNAVFTATAPGAAGVMVDAEGLRRLARALEFGLFDYNDCAAWRRMRRARAPWPAAAAAEVVAVMMQRYVRWPVKFCAYRLPDDGAEMPQDHGTAIFETAMPEIGKPVADAAFTIVLSLVEDALRLRRLQGVIAREMHHFIAATQPSTPAADALFIAKRAAERGLPWSAVRNSSYVRIGLGQHGHILKGTESTRMSSIGVAIARDKAMAHKLLAEAGLPVARQRVARTEKEALAAAAELGYPLVVKPLTGNMGRDVTVGVTNSRELIRALDRAVARSGKAVIESLIQGEETRILVAGGKFMAAVRRIPAQVTGDGEHSVAELVKTENKSPIRDAFLRGAHSVMKPIVLDKDARSLLAQQGLSVDDVPSAGQVVFLRRESNVSRGGAPVDCTDELHPSVRRAAEQAAAAMRLDVCGVDFISTDLTRPWKETGGAICEVNSRPGMNMHIWAAGQKRGKFILDNVFDALVGKRAGADFPVLALVGKPAVTDPLRKTFEAAAKRAGRRLGIAGGGDDLAVSSRRLKSVSDLFRAGDIDAALIVAEPGQLLADGLGLPRVAAAIMPRNIGRQTPAVREILKKISGDTVLFVNDADMPRQAVAALGLPTETLALQARAKAKPAKREAVTPQDNYTVLFTGDIGFGDSYLHSPRLEPLRQLLPVQVPDYCISNLTGLLRTADHIIGNLEVPLADRPAPALEGRKNYLGWCDGALTVSALRKAGFDAVSLANNHILDCGVEGLAGTMRQLSEAGIHHFGAGGRDSDAIAPYLHRFEVGGQRRTLVVFGGFEYRRRYHRRYRWYATPVAAGVGVISPERIGEWIRQNGDALDNPIFIAFPHWGVDYEGINDAQRATAARLIGNGIDLIIGHGAHVAQPVEIIGGKTVVFNLGNFIWNTPGRFGHLGAPPYGAAAALRFRADSAEPPSLNIYPLMIDNDVTRFQTRPVTGSEIEPSLDVIAGALPQRPVAVGDDVGHYVRLTI
ncbi:MAG: CapA family protein [Paracoccus sp. (in: a-proteobacteria)]|nr:CapA family protein [Paracoccus sp. (in: a-proteobacteria)]